MAEAKVDVVISAHDEASKVFGKVGGSAADLAKGLAVGVAAAGAAVATGLGFAVKAAADFDKQMSAVGAVSGASADQRPANRPRRMALSAVFRGRPLRSGLFI